MARVQCGYLTTFMGTVCVVLLLGLVFSRRAPLQMYLFGTAKGHNGPRAISKSGCQCIVLLIVL